MKKFYLMAMATVLMMLALASNTLAYSPDGLLHGKPMTFGTSAFDVISTEATDGNETTYVEYPNYASREIWYEFTNPHTLTSMKSHSTGNGIFVRFFDENGEQIDAIVEYAGTDIETVFETPIEGVMKVSVNQAQWVLTLYEFDVFGTEETLDTTPPALPIDIAAVAGNSQVSLSWNANTELDLAGYNVYRDGEKINTSIVTATTYLDTGLTNGVEYTYTITAIDISDNESVESTGVNVTPQGLQEPTLNVVIAEERLSIDQEFTADVVLKDVTNIYAQDFTVEYDNTKFEYLGYEEVTGHKVYNEPVDDNGKLRFIVASQGVEYGITGEKTFIKLKLKAKAVGIAKVDALQCRVADTESEYDLEGSACGEDSVTIQQLDVNRNGKYTLLDLAIQGFYFGKPSIDANPDIYTADQTDDLFVNDDDLVYVVNQMLLNPDYTPNS